MCLTEVVNNNLQSTAISSSRLLCASNPQHVAINLSWLYHIFTCSYQMIEMYYNSGENKKGNDIVTIKDSPMPALDSSAMEIVKRNKNMAGQKQFWYNFKMFFALVPLDLSPTSWRQAAIVLLVIDELQSTYKRWSSRSIRLHPNTSPCFLILWAFPVLKPLFRDFHYMLIPHDVVVW